MADEVQPDIRPTSPRRKVSPELAVAAVIALLLLIFILQNSDDTPVTWLVVDKHAPLWVVIFVSAVAGYLVGQVIEFGIKRRRRSHERSHKPD